MKSEAFPSLSLSIPLPPPYNNSVILMFGLLLFPIITCVFPFTTPRSPPPKTFCIFPELTVIFVFLSIFPEYPPPNMSFAFEFVIIIFVSPKTLAAFPPAYTFFIISEFSIVTFVFPFTTPSEPTFGEYIKFFLNIYSTLIYQIFFITPFKFSIIFIFFIC